VVRRLDFPNLLPNEEEPDILGEMANFKSGIGNARDKFRMPLFTRWQRNQSSLVKLE
jgi:hypothetical protein